MFELLIENASLKKIVQNILDNHFVESYNDSDLLIIIADEDGLNSAGIINEQNFVVCFINKLLSSRFDYIKNIEIIDYPLSPTSFIIKLEHIVKKVTVPYLKKIIKIQGFIFKPDEFLLILSDNNQETILTEKERNILMILYSYGEIPVSRDVMLKKIWKYAPDVETHTLETHIYRLRQKIELNPSDPKILITDDDGYRLIC